MLLRKKKKDISEPLIFPQNEFRNAMSFLKYNCEMEQDIQVKLAVIDYFMCVVKADIQSSLLSSMLYNQSAVEIHYYEIFPTDYFDENGETHTLEETAKANECIDLSKDTVFVIPWKGSRTIAAVWGLLIYGYMYESTNISATYYTEADFTFVFNGRHHTAAGIVRREGFIRANRLDIKPLFPHVYTDGREWFDIHTNKSISKLYDFRFGLLFEAAKIRNELLDGKSIDIQHVDDLTERAAFVRSLSGDLDGRAYYKLIDERNYYKYRRDLEKAIASPNESETVIRIKPYDL